MIDFGVGWRAVPGMFSEQDGATAQIAVSRAPTGQAVVEMGAWCGRSLASMCEVLPAGVVAYSYDNYLEDSQANTPESPITPTCAMKLRQVVERHYLGLGRDVRCEVKDSVTAGKEYVGPPIAVLFIDDHHSADQLAREFEAWLPHLAPKVTVLLHDYAHQEYGLDVVAVNVLPVVGFSFIGIRAGSGIGIWTRGYQ